MEKIELTKTEKTYRAFCNADTGYLCLTSEEFAQIDFELFKTLAKSHNVTAELEFDADFGFVEIELV